MSDTNAAAIVAAIEVLGAEIERLHAVADAQLAMIREHEDENAALRDELAHARQQADAATRKAAALMERPTWDAVQRLMVQSGIDAVRRLDPFRWRAVVGSREWVGESLAEAAGPAAANAWAAAHGKAANE